MNTFLKHFLIYILLFIFSYLGYSFYVFNLNPEKWTKEERGYLFAVYAVVVFLWNMFYFYYQIGIFNKQSQKNNSSSL